MKGEKTGSGGQEQVEEVEFEEREGLGFTDGSRIEGRRQQVDAPREYATATDAEFLGICMAWKGS